MRAGIGLQEIEWSDLCREGVTGRGEISDCQGVKSGHTEVGNAVLTHHRRSGWEKHDWSSGSAVLLSVPMVDPPCGSGLPQLWDVGLLVGVAQCLTKQDWALSRINNHHSILPIYNKS